MTASPGPFNLADAHPKLGLNLTILKLSNLEIIRFINHFSCSLICTDVSAPSSYDRRNMWQKRKEKLNTHMFASGEGLDFLNLVMKMVVTNSDERTLMAVLLTGPFMRAGRPKRE